MLSIPAHVRTVVNEDGAAVLDVSRNQITTLNSTGGFIWERLRQGRTVEEAIRDLAAATNTDFNLVNHGVHTFLDQLRSEHLLLKPTKPGWGI
jgi:6-phosphogluconate dehydrogenase (decarboxylating)